MTIKKFTQGPLSSFIWSFHLTEFTRDHTVLPSEYDPEVMMKNWANSILKKTKRCSGKSVNLKASVELTVVHFGKNWATPPDLSCPLRSVRTRGDTAQPSLSLPGWFDNFWWPWRRTGPGQEDRSFSSCLATSPLVLHPRSEPKSLISDLVSVNENNIWLLLDYWTLVFFHGYFGFYCSCCTNHNQRRSWSIFEYHPFRCWTETHHEML